MILASLNRYRDLGLLLIRVGLGLMFMLHGIPKLIGGPALWTGLASGVGLTIAPVFWGFMAAFAEAVGGLFLILGLFHRIAALLLFLDMAGALAFHLQQQGPAGEFSSGYSRPIEMMIVFLGLFLIGAGRYSVDECTLGRSPAQPPPLPPR
ncbi:MAG TPA: DoxX family protein [Tepidisphaeraceae bacterium]|nr:DoxX family protein [Tepidisphaeraceae bacterium]